MATWWNDFKNNSLNGLSQPPNQLAENGSTNGAGIDMKEAQEGLFATVVTGAAAQDGEVYVRLEESKDDGVNDPYTDLIDFITGVQARFDDIGANSIASLNFKRSKRFVRAVSTVGGGPTIFVAVSIHGMRRRVL